VVVTLKTFCARWQVKADKIISNAKEEALGIKAHAREECERLIADIDTQALRVCKKKPTHLTLQFLSSD
jgi:F0F1-type ATP synthase membrane subunit b/b'